jgi:hypothetical protein
MVGKRYFMKPLLLFVCLLCICTAQAQLKTSTQNQCGTLVVDILDGKVNGVKANFTPGEIKKKLPCFTSEEPESSTAKCGGLIAYKDQDIYFYTARNYVEIGEKFKGRLTVPLMGAARNGLFKYLGNPKMKDTNWDAYQSNYGIIILYFNKANKVNKIRFSTETTDTINLCE